jgi:hypothetical protein
LTIGKNAEVCIKASQNWKTMLMVILTDTFSILGFYDGTYLYKVMNFIILIKKKEADF